MQCVTDQHVKHAKAMGLARGSGVMSRPGNIKFSVRRMNFVAIMNRINLSADRLSNNSEIRLASNKVAIYHF